MAEPLRTELKPDYKVKAPQFLINLAKPYNLNPKP